MGLFDRLRAGLSKTRQVLVDRVRDAIRLHKKIDEGLYEELEEALLRSDVGVSTTIKLLERLRAGVRAQRIEEAAQLEPLLRSYIEELLGDARPLQVDGHDLRVIMVVGVNGTGKTTTIGKLAHRLKQQGHRVMLAAADTFRAAAADQLEIWGQRVGVPVIRHQEGADAAAVAFDAIQAARSRRAGVLLVDTAGRLHTKTNLMEELKKVQRVIAREVAGAPHDVLLVLDGTTGQNAVQQARLFGQAVGVTGIVLTKLDGTARGGVVVAVAAEEGLPVQFVGVGEQMEDLQPFDPSAFVAALFERD